MSQLNYVQMAKDLVSQQIQIGGVASAEIVPLLQSTFLALQSLDQGEEALRAMMGQQGAVGVSRVVGWQQSITKHIVTCLECGAKVSPTPGVTFRQLSARHLSTHDLTPRSYRAKHGMPQTQPLSAREVTTRRRELAKEIRPWELARAAKIAAKEGKAIGGRATAK